AGRQALAQRLALGMREERRPEDLQRLLDAVAQLLAHAAALLDALLVIAFQEAIARVVAAREARRVQEAEEQGELAEQVRADHRLEVELEVRRRGEDIAVAQEPQPAPVRNDAPERVRAVQELLHDGV